MKTKCLTILTLTIGLFTTSALMAEEEEPAEGQIAPDFSITRLDGKQFSLSEFRGKKSVYLVFWNTWCTYCMKKIPKLKQTQSLLNENIEIIAVNTGLKDSVKKSIAFQKRFEINYPLAFDHDKKVTDLYGVWGTPTEFIIDINGIIRHRDSVPEDLKSELADWNQIIPAQSIADAECDSSTTTTC